MTQTDIDWWNLDVEQFGYYKPCPRTPPLHGQPPSAPGSDTSEDAAESMSESAPSYRRRVLEFINSRGTVGATSDEVQAALGLTHQNGSARVSELANRYKLIVDSGQKRRTRSGRKAVVYVVKR